MIRFSSLVTDLSHLCRSTHLKVDFNYNRVVWSFFSNCQNQYCFTHDNCLSGHYQQLQRFSHFTSSYSMQSSSFTMYTDVQGVSLTLSKAVQILDSLAPLHLAESWDNVGLLLEPSENLIVNKILLTIDLTESVLEEAINKQINLIIAYHPPIFHSFKRLTWGSWKNRIVLKCAQNGIAIYSPHTALDAIKEGINDWLLRPFSVFSSKPIQQSYANSQFNFYVDVSFSDDQAFQLLNNISIIETKQLAIKNSEAKYNLQIACNQQTLLQIEKILSQFQISSKITKLEKRPVIDHGMGRVGYLINPLPLSEIVEMVKKHLNIPYVRLALGQYHSKDTQIKCIAVCAGSGGSILKNVDADLIITGEMTHHEVLDSVHSGSSVILCEHSNTERGYLLSWIQCLYSSFSSNNVHITISEVDRDPLNLA